MNYMVLTVCLAVISLLFCNGYALDFNLDFSKFANMGFKDDLAGDGKGGWSDQGPENDFNGFDFRRKDYDAVSFSVLNPAENSGKAVLTFDNEHAKTGLKAVCIKLTEPRPQARFLYLLHASCWNVEAKGTAIASIEVNFSDGSSVSKELRTGIDIGDWWNAGRLENGKPAVLKSHGAVNVGVYLSKFEISSVSREVSSVEFKSNGKVVWIVIGATLSTEDHIFKADAPRRFAADTQWKAVDIKSLQVKADSALDLSSLVESGPAGKHGRVIVSKAGRLAFEDAPEKSIRFFGFNWWQMYSSAGKAFWAKRKHLSNEDMEAVKSQFSVFIRSARLQGYNMIRITLFDGFLMEGAAEDCIPNPQRQDLMDWFIAKCKEQGIYVYMSPALHGAGKKDLAKAWKERNLSKAKMLIGDPDVRNCWRRFSEHLLKHVNPYTGLAWKDEPAIAFIEYYNELDGGTSKGVLEKLDPETKTAYEAKWRLWLDSKVPGIRHVADAYALPLSQENPMSNEFALFIASLAKENLLWFKKNIEEIGYKGLTAQYNHSNLMNFAALRWENSETTAINCYFAHPTGDSLEKVTQGSSLPGSYWYANNALRFANSPFLVTEWNHGFWNPWQHEGGLLFPAYSSFQDYSALIVHADPVSMDYGDAALGAFDVSSSPVGRANELLSAFLFARVDVQTAKRSVQLVFPSAYLNKNRNARSFPATDAQGKIGLMTGFSIAFSDLPSAAQSKSTEPEIILQPEGGSEAITGEWFSSTVVKENNSDLSTFTDMLKFKGILSSNNISSPKDAIFQNETGELTMRAKEQLLKAVTPRTEAVTMKAGRSEVLDCLTVNSLSVNALVAAVALDGRTLFDSKRIILIISTETANSGMELSSDGINMLEQGTTPILMRCGNFDLSLKHRGAMAVYALALDGSRREKLASSFEDGLLKINIDSSVLKNGPTPFFELLQE